MLRSLHQRLIIFLVLPVALLLATMGVIAFIYARGVMHDQWREAAILKLERAAQHIDKRLSQPIDLLKMMQKAADTQRGHGLQSWILDRIRELDGVAGVAVEWESEGQAETERFGQGRGWGRRESGGDMMRVHRARIAEVSAPTFDTKTEEETVSLISYLEDEEGKVLGRLRVALRFGYLMQDIRSSGWWQSDTGFLVDPSGRFLARTPGAPVDRERLGETRDPLERAVLEEMKGKSSGTILGPGHPPEQIGGFYTLQQAPWTLVLFAPGEQILAPILIFRFYFAVAGLLVIALVLLLIRMVGGSMVRAIREVSETAERVARGAYGEPLPVKTRDEIGRLVQSFNTMILGLRERDFISDTFGRYVDQEVAREFMRRPEASRLGGEKRQVAILMSDLREFTPLAETRSPDLVLKILNRYFSWIIATIQKHRGIIVDFFGDAVLVFFDPMEGPVVPTIHQAIRCALEMQSVMETFNGENRADGLPELRMGIGVHVGEVVVGNIGSETRAKYGIVGSAVNMTQRIQSYAGGGEVIVTEAIHGVVKDHLQIKRQFEAQLKGIRESATLYVIEGSTASNGDE